MEARPASDVYDDEPWAVAAVYRVTLWEQPARRSDAEQARSGVSSYPSDGIQYGTRPGAAMGWQEMTFELVGARDVREAIQWAEAALASGEGPASRRGREVQDREYVVYAKAQATDQWLHVAGWIPVLPPDDPSNLPGLREHS